MDELRRQRRLKNRLALVTLIACSTTSVFAEEAFKAPPTPHSFGSLLSQGWTAGPTPTLVRPKLRVLEVDREAVVHNQRAAPPSLARLIKLRAKPIAINSASVNDSNSAGVDVEFAPAVNRFVADRQNVSRSPTGLAIEDATSIQVARPIRPLVPETPITPVPEVPIRSVPEVPITRSVDVQPVDVPLATSVAEDSIGDQSALPPAATGALLGFRHLSSSDVQPDTPVRLERHRDADVLRGADRAMTSMTSTTESVHVIRLREQARESLRMAKNRLDRQATHSARKYALAALRSIVAMQDVQVGGNRHAKQLDAAFDSIREAEDFCGRFGAIDQKALKRMVTVHETGVLKDKDLDNLSAIEATDAYLRVARENLVAASAGSREASDALVLLGRIEKQVSRVSESHSAAVAVMLQRSAIDVDDRNGSAYHSLGVTFLQQSLFSQASWALKKSLEIHPTRSAYLALLGASRRLGDVDTARLCNLALQGDKFPNDMSVRSLTPSEFASTYRPVPQAMQPVKQKTVAPVKTDSKQDEPPHRAGLRSIFSFSRR